MRLASLLLGISTLAVSLAAPAHAGEAGKLAESFNRTGLGLMGALSATSGNLALSPYGLGSLMAMVHSGAGGDTRDEIATALGFEGFDVPVAAKELDGKVAGGDGAKFTVANALMLTREGDRVAAAYRDLLEKSFAAQVAPGADLDKVNAWAKEKTGGRIGAILKQIDPQSVAVLLDAVTLDARWAHPFAAASTAEATFTLAGGEAVQAPTMRVSSDFRMAESEAFTAVELPYAADRMAMAVLLPVQGKAPDEAALRTIPLLIGALSAATAETTEVRLPKLAIDAEANLAGPLQKLGVKLPFDDLKADFSAMLEGKEGPAGVYITQIRQRVAITVDESGTQAAAVSAAEFAMRSLTMPRKFVADRPFLFAVYDRETKAILFLGRVDDPRAQKA